MSTFDEVIETAARQLDDRGLLLDLHISQLAGGDKSLVDLVRKCLTTAGVAADRFGMGLARVGKAGVCVAAWRDGRLQAAQGNVLTAESEPEVVEQEVADWWLMSKGSVRGPWPLSQLIAMQTSQQLSLADLVRQGSRGPWLSPQQVAELAAAVPEVPPAVEVSPLSESPEPASPLLPRVEWKTLPGSHPQTSPKRAESIETNPLSSETPSAVAAVGDRRSDSTVRTRSKTALTGSSPDMAQIAALANSIAPEARRSNAALQTRSGVQVLTRPLFRSGIESFVAIVVSPFTIVGGRLLSDVRKLASLVLVPMLGAGALVALWWFWPPSTAAILSDFEAIHRQVQTLQRSKLSEAELAGALQPQRRRLQRIVHVLEGRATDEQSVHRELLLAGKHGLLVIVEYPRQSELFEEMYATHMKLAKMLNDGVELQATSQQPDAVIGTPPPSLPAADPGADVPQ